MKRLWCIERIPKLDFLLRLRESAASIVTPHHHRITMLLRRALASALSRSLATNPVLGCALVFLLFSCQPSLNRQPKVGALERVGRLPHGVVPFRSKPPEISTARGRVLYDIHCAVCHGLTGSGKTVLGLRGFKSPSLLKSLSDNEVVNAILQGKGKMYSFQDRLEENEARAIAAYLKALRFSQAARFLDLPPEDRAELEKR